MSTWISVDDRLPITEEDFNAEYFLTVEVLCSANGQVWVDEFQAGRTCGFWSNFTDSEPTHWMPLPKSPKELV